MYENYQGLFRVILLHENTVKRKGVKRTKV